jgi:two-component system, chemotaxis family, protein-glutamate methylesterase/glutaminase
MHAGVHRHNGLYWARMSAPAFSAFDIVAIASSMGGIEALADVVLPSLPGDFPAAVALCQHQGPNSRMALARMFGRRCRLPVSFADTGTPLERGRVYLAPPDQHLLVRRNGAALLSRGAKVKFCRPAADPLMVSAAATFGPRTLGVVLTGCNTDGSAGVQAIKWSGGMVLAQDPETSRAAGMPRAAIATGCVDLVLPLRAIAPALIALVMAPGAADFLRVPLRAA